MELIVHDDRALLALQGPSAAAVLQDMVDLDLSKLYFSGFVKSDIAGVPSFITRTGCGLHPCSTTHRGCKPACTSMPNELMF